MKEKEIKNIIKKKLPAKKRRGGDWAESALGFGCSPEDVTGQAKMS